MPTRPSTLQVAQIELDQAERVNRPAQAEAIVQLAIQRDSLFQYRHSVGVFLREEQRIAGPPEDPRLPGLVTNLPKQGKRFRQHRFGLRDGVPADDSREGRVVQSVGQRAVVSLYPGELDTFVVETLGDRHVRLPVGESAGGLEGGQPLLWEVAAV